MTPNILSYGWAEIEGRSWAYELSEGRGIENEPIWGVSFRDPERPEYADLEYSRLFYSKNQAINQILNPKKEEE
jgi:hypothetical protein